MMNLIDIVTHKVVEREVQACRWCPIPGLILFMIFFIFIILVLTHPNPVLILFLIFLNFLIFFLTIILYHSYVFPNPSKRRPGELRALVVPLEKVRCRLILKMCHVLLCQSLYQQFILHTVRIDFCVQIRDPRGSSRFTLCDDSCNTTVHDSNIYNRDYYLLPHNYVHQL